MFSLISVGPWERGWDKMKGETDSSRREGPIPFGNVFISLYTKDRGLLMEGAGRERKPIPQEALPDKKSMTL